MLESARSAAGRRQDDVGARDELEAALGQLSAEHRAMIVLRYLLEYTPGEIGRMLDLPRGTVNSRLRRGLDRLSELLGEEPMIEERLREGLRAIPVPDEEGARERGRRLIEAAARPVAGAGPRSRRRGGRRAAQVAVALGLLVAAAISPAGAAVRDWVGDAVDNGHQPSLPALTSLPAPGPLLVDSARGAWVVQEDGSKRLLGSYRQSTWSPRGLFVAAVGEGELVAARPRGRGSLGAAAPGRPATRPGLPTATGSPISIGAPFATVAGDGTGDHQSWPRAAPPSLRPGGPARACADARSTPAGACGRSTPTAADRSR